MVKAIRQGRKTRKKNRKKLAKTMKGGGLLQLGKKGTDIAGKLIYQLDNGKKGVYSPWQKAQILKANQDIIQYLKTGARVVVQDNILERWSQQDGPAPPENISHHPIQTQLSEAESVQRERMEAGERSDSNALIGSVLNRLDRRSVRKQEEEGWTGVGITATGRDQYIKEFCFGHDSPFARQNMKAIEVFIDLTLLLNFLPKVVYRDFGCRHDFFDVLTGKSSYTQDEKMFLNEMGRKINDVLTEFHLEPMSNQALTKRLADLLNDVDDFDEFMNIQRSMTCSTPKMHYGWRILHTGIIEWIVNQPWGKYFNCMPLTITVPRERGRGKDNAEVLLEELVKLEPGDGENSSIDKRLLGIFDINGIAGRELCSAVIDLTGLAQIDGAVVNFKDTNSRIVARVNQNQTCRCGALTVRNETRGIYFQYVGPKTAELTHNINIWWGEPDTDGSIVIARCPDRLSVNQILANIRELGGVVAASAVRGASGSEVPSCDFQWTQDFFGLGISDQSLVEKQIEILETAKALGDYFPCEISSRIANAGSIQRAEEEEVVSVTVTSEEVDQELRRLLTEPDFAICLLQTGDHLAFWQNVSMGNTTLLNCGRSLVLSIPRNVFSSDVRPILIKQFVEKIKEMQTIILMKEFLLHAVRDCLPTGGDESLAAIVMKQNYIRKIHIFLMKANESIRMIMQILIRLEKGDDAAALTLMQKNNERISCNVTLLIDSVFGEIIEDEGIYTQLHIDHHAGCSGRLIVSEREIEEDEFGVLKGTMATAARKAQDTGILMMIGLTTPSENPDVRLVKRIDQVMGAARQHVEESGQMLDPSTILDRIITPGETMNALRALTEKFKGRQSQMIPAVVKAFLSRKLRGPISFSTLLTDLGINHRAFLRYLQTLDASGQGKKTQQRKTLVNPDEIHMKNWLIGAPFVNDNTPAQPESHGGGRTARAGGSKVGRAEITTEQLEVAVRQCTLEQILGSYNQVRLMESFDGHGHFTKDTCNQLAYLTTAIILWYRASDIIDDIRPGTIASLIVESVSEHHDTIYVLVEELARLVCGNLGRRIQPLDIAQHVWNNQGTLKFGKAVAASEIQSVEQQHWEHLGQAHRECMAEFEAVLKNTCQCVRDVASGQALRVVVFSEVKDECTRGFALSPPPPPRTTATARSPLVPPPPTGSPQGPVPVDVKGLERTVFRKAREGISGIAFLNWAAVRRIINRAGVLCDSNGNALAVSADGPHFFCGGMAEDQAADMVIHYWRTKEPGLALWGGGARRRKTRKKKKRKRKKTRRRKKHKRKTRRKR